MSVPYVFNGTTLSVLVKNKMYHVNKSVDVFDQVKEAVFGGVATEDELESLLDRPKAVASYVEGSEISVRENGIFYGDELLHGLVCDRILEFQAAGLPIKPLVNFIARLMNNPSSKSRDELYAFLEHKYLPITEDGMVRAYKAVRADFKDKYTGKLDNSVGSVVKMDRRFVDDNHNNHCSKGLHVGALDYVSGYRSGNDVIVIVEFDPANAVSVPTDHNYTKLRVCEYKVVGLYQGEMTQPLYKSDSLDAWEDEDESDAYNEYEDDEEDSWDSWQEEDDGF